MANIYTPELIREIGNVWGSGDLAEAGKLKTNGWQNVRGMTASEMAGMLMT